MNKISNDMTFLFFLNSGLYRLLQPFFFLLGTNPIAFSNE